MTQISGEARFSAAARWFKDGVWAVSEAEAVCNIGTDVWPASM